MSETLLEPVETIGSKVVVSTWDTTIFAELPKRAFNCLGSMIYTKLESHDGGEKEKVVPYFPVPFCRVYGWSVPSSKKVRRNLDWKFWFGFDISTLWVPRFVHESDTKRKLPLGLGEPTITDV
jgi:hypothetical protein